MLRAMCIYCWLASETLLLLKLQKKKRIGQQFPGFAFCPQDPASQYGYSMVEPAVVQPLYLPTHGSCCDVLPLCASQICGKNAYVRKGCREGGREGSQQLYILDLLIIHRKRCRNCRKTGVPKPQTMVRGCQPRAQRKKSSHFIYYEKRKEKNLSPAEFWIHHHSLILTCSGQSVFGIVSHSLLS